MNLKTIVFNGVTRLIPDVGLNVDGADWLVDGHGSPPGDGHSFMQTLQRPTLRRCSRPSVSVLEDVEERDDEAKPSTRVSQKL